MSKPAKSFDVWFVTANTVYRSVPYSVVTGWTQEGRLAATDMVRPAGANVPWTAVSAHELLADYMPRQVPSVAVPANVPAQAIPAPGAAPGAAPGEAPAEHVELPEPEELTYRKPHSTEDDDVDMIPLIDVSMVLLVFFIIMRAAGATAPVDVPELRYAGQLSNDPDAITINIDKKGDDVYYSVRQGAASPRPEHDNLATPEDAIKALDGLLAEASSPPKVRVACHKALPRGRVYELRKDLDVRQKKNQINSFEATVIEAPQPKN